MNASRSKGHNGLQSQPAMTCVDSWSVSRMCSRDCNARCITPGMCSGSMHIMSAIICSSRSMPRSLTFPSRLHSMFTSVSPCADRKSAPPRRMQDCTTALQTAMCSARKCQKFISICRNVDVCMLAQHRIGRDISALGECRFMHTRNCKSLASRLKSTSLTCRLFHDCTKVGKQVQQPGFGRRGISECNQPQLQPILQQIQLIRLHRRTMIQSSACLATEQDPDSKA